MTLCKDCWLPLDKFSQDAGYPHDKDVCIQLLRNNIDEFKRMLDGRDALILDMRKEREMWCAKKGTV